MALRLALRVVTGICRARGVSEVSESARGSQGLLRNRHTYNAHLDCLQLHSPGCWQAMYGALHASGFQRPAHASLPLTECAPDLSALLRMVTALLVMHLPGAQRNKAVPASSCPLLAALRTARCMLSSRTACGGVCRTSESNPGCGHMRCSDTTMRLWLHTSAQTALCYMLAQAYGTRTTQQM